MKPEFFWMPRICFAADDPAGGAGAGDPPADPGAGGATAGDPPADPQVDTPADPPVSRWWEGKGLTDEQRDRVTAMGLTVDDPIQAIARLTDMELAAQRKLGKPADQLMDRPGKDQDVAEWLRTNGEMFGIPESADGYEMNRPEGWPKDAPWDEGFEAEARKIAHEEGIRGAALQRFTELYAGKVQGLMQDAEADLAAANQTMQATLQKDWGDQYGAKVARAQQAASVIAEAAGLDTGAIEALAGTLKPKVGDAGTIRMFAAIGEMLGEDKALLTGGGGALGSTPAEARAERSRLMAPGGEWFEATRNNDRAAIERLKPKMEQLAKLAAG